MSQLPLFPLNVVLFPGMVLPLHIFEERYKALINACISEATPFGVLLAQSDEEGREVVSAVGTTAHILEVDRLSDGRLNIIAMGRQRFRVRQVVRHDPYLVAEIEEYPLSSGDARQSQERTGRVRALLDEYLKLLGQTMGTTVRIGRIPSTPLTVAYLVAIVMQIPLSEKQQLLEVPTYPQLLQQEEAFLLREKALLRYIVETHPPPEEDGGLYGPDISEN